VPLDTHGVPVVAIAGTCMNSGKTAAACAIVSRFPAQRRRRRRVQVDRRRAAPRHPRDGRLGRAPRRDVLGLRHLCDDVEERARRSRAACSTSSSDEKPDAIVFELGDGLLGAYGVEAILRDKEIVARITAMVLCANDPVGAWGGAQAAARGVRHRADVISGPATDNQVGIDIIRTRRTSPH
jgi:hypothetical protein